MGKIVIIEPKSISEYLNQIEEIGENISEHETIWGYSPGETKRRLSLYEYPKYNFKVTEKITNFIAG